MSTIVPTVDEYVIERGKKEIKAKRREGSTRLIKFISLVCVIHSGANYNVRPPVFSS